MKFSELKNKFKINNAIRVIAGVLMVAMLGTSYGVWQVNAAKPSIESVSEEATEKKLLQRKQTQKMQTQKKPSLN